MLYLFCYDVDVAKCQLSFEFIASNHQLNANNGRIPHKYKNTHTTQFNGSILCMRYMHNSMARQSMQSPLHYPHVLRSF